MKILVTGGCGFVGRHLVNRLKGNDVTVVDDLSTGIFQEGTIVKDCIDFFNNSNEHFDVIFHLAAVVEGRMTIENDPMKVAKDLMIDAAMFRWAVRTRPKIVYFSSSAAYPINLQGKVNQALKESMLDFNTIGVPDMSYGWAKMTGEFLSRLAVEKHGLQVAVYRPFSGYGEDQAMTYPFPSIVKRVIDSTGTVDVWGSGEQSRDFIYIEDCIDIILGTYEKINNGSALNLCSGKQTTFKELITLIASILGKEVKINPLFDKPEGVFARYGDRTIQDTFGIPPKTSLEDGIKKVVESLKK